MCNCGPYCVCILKRHYRYVCFISKVDNDGVLELEGASSSAFVYAFSADVDTSGIGQVFYRKTTDPSMLFSVNERLDETFPELAPNNMTSLFVATWFYVGYFDSHVDRVCYVKDYYHHLSLTVHSLRPMCSYVDLISDNTRVTCLLSIIQTNTFQCAVATNGDQSFVALLYADEMIEWMTGDADGGMNGLGGDRADVGLVSELPTNSFFLPASNTSAVLMLDSMSNVDLDGFWVFRTDGETVEQPSKLIINGDILTTVSSIDVPKVCGSHSSVQSLVTYGNRCLVPPDTVPSR